MNGFKIEYLNVGVKEVTWFGEPDGNIPVPKSGIKDIVMMMFNNAHPGCKVISCEACTVEEFSKQNAQ